MKTVLKILLTTFIFFCVATVIAQAIIAGVVWLKGGLTEEKRQRILAVCYDIDLAALRAGERQAAVPASAIGQSPEVRILQSAEVVARRESFRTSRLQLLGLEGRVKDEKRKSKLRITDFDSFLDSLENEALDAGLLEVRQTLEVMQTKQARSQLLRMLDDGAMDDVVKIVKAMPLTKRKKIFSEFKTQDDAERLHAILRQLRELAALPEDEDLERPRS